MGTMKSGEPSSIQTRPSLLNRLKAGDDVVGWQEFYLLYGKLVRDFAIQAGLTDTEADEVVQETAIALARHLPAFTYDPKVCRFKTWLLNQSAWRIKDQLKKRRRVDKLFGRAPDTAGPAPPVGDDTARTATIERVPDPASVNLEVMFDTEWRKNLLAVALERMKGKFSLRQFQIFDLYVLKEWPAADIAQSLGVSRAQIYLTKHRLSGALEKELARLEVGLRLLDRT